MPDRSSTPATGSLRSAAWTCSRTPHTSNASLSWNELRMADVGRGFGVAAGLDSEVAGELARLCEGLGYRSVWSNDHPGASGLETASAFHEAAPAVEVGVAVLALDRQDPDGIAAKADEEGLDPGRLWVGIGAGFTKTPLGVVREGLAELRIALPASARIAVAAMGPKMSAPAGAEADGGV